MFRALVVFIVLNASVAAAQFLPVAGAGRGNGAPCIDTVVTPYQLATSSMGLLIADYEGFQARVCGVTSIMRLLGNLPARVFGIARDDLTGTTYASTLDGKLYAIDATRALHEITVPGMVAPYGLAVSDTSLWVADRGANAVWQLSIPCLGTCPGTRVLDSTLVKAPQGVVLKRGALYVTDTSGSRVLRRNADGTVSLIAGTGTAGFSGDGGPATAAMLSYPTGVAVADDGSVFIADNANHRVRMVSPSGIISTVVGTGVANTTHRRPVLGDDPRQFPVTNPAGVAVGITQLPGRVIADEVLWYGSVFDGAVNALVLPIGPPPIPPTATATETQTTVPTSTASDTPAATATETPSATKTFTFTPTRVATATFSPIPTSTATSPPAPTCVPECIP